MLNFDLRAALRLYAITDRAWLGNQTLYAQVEAALSGGVTMLQLREKDMPDDLFLAEARQIKQLADAYQVPLIINDNLAVALSSGAAGLHIGQDDCPVTAARQALGAEKILGVSAQTVEQALAAEAAGADYLGVGAIYSTATKTDAKLVSPEKLAEICRAVKIPVVAIGGLTADNLPPLLASGIVGAALVSAVFAQPDIAAACRRLSEVIKL